MGSSLEFKATVTLEPLVGGKTLAERSAKNAVYPNMAIILKGNGTHIRDITLGDWVHRLAHVGY